MLTFLAHPGAPAAPHDLWTAWQFEPALVAVLVTALWLHRRGAAGHPPVWRSRAFVAGIAIVAMALMSPLDAASTALASAHMVQHVLLVLVAAPLVALSAPGARLWRGLPRPVRRRAGRWRAGLGLTPSRLRTVRHPAVVWLMLAAALWVWHAAVPYGAALASEPLHVLEHTSFLVTAVLFWSVVVSAGRMRGVSHGTAVLMVFTMAMQSTFLSVLLTFAGEPWYAGYAHTTGAFGLDPLADQQLAGVLMWVPAGAVYAATGVALVALWLRDSEPGSAPPGRDTGAAATSTATADR